MSFNPTFGTLYSGKSIHIHSFGFGQIKELPPQCLFLSSNESTVATVLISTWVKCTLPPADSKANTTTVALSFNGGSDVASTEKVFTYISPSTIETVSPNYISSSGGAKVTIGGKDFLPDGNFGGSRCSFGDTVVAGTATTTEMVVCFAPPTKSGLVEVGISINGVDFTTNTAMVMYHLPTAIHEVIPPFAPETGCETIVVKGANFSSLSHQ